MRSYIGMGSGTRGMAFYFIAWFLVATAIGSVLPEFGDILAQAVGIWSHTFNVIFLAVGIAGIGLALYLGYSMRG